MAKKARKNAANSSKRGSEKVAESKALSLAEELVIGGADSDVTTDEVVVLSCGKPPKAKFFRVHPSIRADIRILKRSVGVKEERFLVTKSVATQLDYVTPNTAFLSVTLDGKPFLWLIGTGDDTWSTSARRIAVDAMTQWVRLVPHNSSGTYHRRVAKNNEQEPDFQELDKKDFSELLLMAFDKDHIITNTDHPVAQEVVSGE